MRSFLFTLTFFFCLGLGFSSFSQSVTPSDVSGLNVFIVKSHSIFSAHTVNLLKRTTDLSHSFELNENSEIQNTKEIRVEEVKEINAEDLCMLTYSSIPEISYLSYGELD